MGCVQGDSRWLYFQPDNNRSLTLFCKDSIKGRCIDKVSYKCLQCWSGELPEPASRYKAIFITGSHYSAYEELPWIDNLVVWLHDFILRGKHDTKIVAVCFGCQVTTHALNCMLMQTGNAAP